MNVLDENLAEAECAQLRRWRIRALHIGRTIGRRGMQDDEIIRLLHQLRRPTFFTNDGDFYNRTLCHGDYCLVHLEVAHVDLAFYVWQVLRHPRFAR